MKKPNNPLGAYAAQFKALTREEEIKCFTLYYETKDERVRTLIYNHTLRVIFILITYRHMYDIDKDDLDDLILILAYHLWELIPKFKMEKKNRFTTFAQFCLDNKAKSYFKKIGKHNEKFVSFEKDIIEILDVQEGVQELESRVIVEEFGEDNGYSSDVIEKALSQLANPSSKKLGMGGYSGRYTVYGEECEFHLAHNDKS